MAHRNREYILKRGEEGSLLEATLYDEDGAVNLTGWTVTVTARRGTAAPVIDDAACTVLADQATTGRGRITYEFDASTANVAKGVYDLEFKGTAADNSVFYFPKSKEKPYGVLRVIESLASA